MLSRLLDDHFRAEMIADFPGIAFYLPQNKETVLHKYDISIDLESKAELVTFIQKLSGLIHVAMYGATCNGKQQVSSLNFILAFIV